MEIGERIKKIRLEQGITQTELGERLGIVKSAVCQVERGAETNLTIDRIRAFADALGCSVGYLIGEESTASEDKQTDFIEFRQAFKDITISRKQIVAVCKRDSDSTYISCTDGGEPYIISEPYDEVIRKIKGGE